MFSYNCTRNEVTGFSPFYLLFGRSPRLPVDLLFGLTPETGTADHKEYIKKWKEQMQEAYDITTKNTKKSAERNKRNYNNKVRSSVLSEGDRVLERNLTPRGGNGKLRNHWEDCIYKVIRQVGEDMPIYEVLPEQGKGRTSRVLHRNLLLPCDNLPLETQLTPTKRKRKTVAQASSDRTVANQEEEESDDDDYGYHCVPTDQSLCVLQPVVLAEQNVNDAEPQQQDLPQQQEIDSVRNVLNGSMTPDREEMQVEDEPVNGQRLPVMPSSLPSDDNEAAQHYQRPVRERRPTRVFTYDRLGHPACYSAGPPSNVVYWCPPLPLPYGTIPPASVWMPAQHSFNYQSAIPGS